MKELRLRFIRNRFPELSDEVCRKLAPGLNGLPGDRRGQTGQGVLNWRPPTARPLRREQRSMRPESALLSQRQEIPKLRNGRCPLTRFY